MGISSDEAWMRYAIRLAERAGQQGEVPVGAVLVKDGHCVAEGWNSPIKTNDATAHAEIVAVRTAGQVLGNYRLLETTLYVTLEPCAMCMGALSHARIKRLVFGAFDPKRGAVCHALSLADAKFLNHRIDWQGGVLEASCSELLTDFFGLGVSVFARIGAGLSGLNLPGSTNLKKLHLFLIRANFTGHPT